MNLPIEFQQWSQCKSDNINSGGCGIYALAIYRYFQKHNMSLDRFRLVVFLRNYQKDMIFPIIENNNIVGNIPSHVVLMLNSMCYDSEGVFEFYKYCKIQDEEYQRLPIVIDMIEEDLVKAINQPESWNTTFDRTSGIETLSYMLNIDLSDIELWLD
mgnify:CR=1 FL=1